MLKITKPMFLVVPAVLLLAALDAAAQTPAGPPPLSIRVTEQATITVEPDEARIDIGVTTQKDSSRAAVAQNAEQLTRAIDALRAAAGPDATVETVSYSVRPEYRYPREGGEPTIAGYVATNIVRVTLHDLMRVGAVIDAATKAGANRVHRIDFTLQDDRTARSRAVRAAAQKAQTQADALAAALGVSVVRVLSAVENEPIARPFVDTVAFRAEAAALTPVEPGTLDVHATVVLTVEIAETSPRARNR